MKPKHQRLIGVVVSLVVMGLGLSGILYAFRDNMVYFYTPVQLQEKQNEPGFDCARSLRIGGLVKKNTIHNLPGGGIAFTITDLQAERQAVYRGLVPSLFREGQGVIAQGTLNADGVLNAQVILAKHDETYMPREVVEALKASGRWQEGVPNPRMPR